MAVRKVSSSGRNIIGRFPSLKLRRMVAFESLIEQDYLYILDYERDVHEFQEQPFSIEYIWQDKARHYTPDFQVTRQQGQALVECKPLAFVTTEENQRKFGVAQKWCLEHGWSFLVVTDQELRSGSRLANIKLLTRYARLEVEPAVKIRVMEQIHKAQDPPTLQSLAQALFPSQPQQGVAVLLHLAFHHQISLPLSVGPLCPDTPIAAAQEVKS